MIEMGIASGQLLYKLTELLLDLVMQRVQLLLDSAEISCILARDNVEVHRDAEGDWIHRFAEDK